MGALTKHLMGGTVGGAAFIAFLFGLHQAPLLAAFFGLATYTGLVYLLPGTRSVPMIAPAVARADWEASLAAGRQAARAIHQLATNNPRAPMVKTIGEIGEIVAQITQRLQEQPECHKLVGQLLRTEAKLILPVLEQYIELTLLPRKGESLQNQLRRSEQIIPLIRNKLDEHYQKLLGDNLLEFEVASETLATFLGVDELDLRELEKKK